MGDPLFAGDRPHYLQKGIAVKKVLSRVQWMTWVVAALEVFGNVVLQETVLKLRPGALVNRIKELLPLLGGQTLNFGQRALNRRLAFVLRHVPLCRSLKGTEQFLSRIRTKQVVNLQTASVLKTASTGFYIQRWIEL